MYPNDNEINFGVINKNLIIADNMITNALFDDQTNDYVDRLSQFFPNKEICAIVLHSVVSLSCLIVFKDGKILRKVMTLGSEGSTLFDEGLPLEQEKNLYQSMSVDEEGKRHYKFENDDDNIDDSALNFGEELPFEIARRYFGDRLDNLSIEAYSTAMTGYLYGNMPENNENLTQNIKAKSKFPKFIINGFLLIGIYIMAKTIMSLFK